MRLINADRLKDVVEYACLQHEDTEKWSDWFKQVIDGEPTVCDIEQIRDEIRDSCYENFPKDYILQIIDKYTK